MKLALVLMINDRDLPFLKLHLDVYKDSFDGICAIVDPMTDSAAMRYMEDIGAQVTFAPWQYNWGQWATWLFKFAEMQGYDAAVRMDADELIWSDAGYHFRQKLTEEATLLLLPRHEFFGDRYHVRGDLWPDHQARAWRLNRGIEVRGAKHEGIDFAAHGLAEDAADPDCKVLRLWDEKSSLYHYGWSSKTAILAAMTKYQRQAQVALGQSPEVAFPPDQPMASAPTIPYYRPQPLSPDEVGAYAPFDR